MSIQPIDLQTLFMRLEQVGKEQASMREAAHVAQATQGSEIARQSEEAARMVNETRDLEEGPESLKDDQESGNAGGRQEEARRKKKKENERKGVFSDPALGSRIDLSG